MTRDNMGPERERERQREMIRLRSQSPKRGAVAQERPGGMFEAVDSPSLI